MAYHLGERLEMGGEGLEETANGQRVGGAGGFDCAVKPRGILFAPLASALVPPPPLLPFVVFFGCCGTAAGGRRTCGLKTWLSAEPLPPPISALRSGGSFASTGLASLACSFGFVLCVFGFDAVDFVADLSNCSRIGGVGDFGWDGVDDFGWYDGAGDDDRQGFDLSAAAL